MVLPEKMDVRLRSEPGGGNKEWVSAPKYSLQKDASERSDVTGGGVRPIVSDVRSGITVAW